MRFQRFLFIIVVLVVVGLTPKLYAAEKINFCGYPDFLKGLKSVGVVVVALADLEGADEPLQKAVADMTRTRLAGAGIEVIEADTIHDTTGKQAMLVITAVSKKTPEGLQAACISLLLLSPYRAWDGGRCDIPLVMWGAVPDTVHIIKPSEFQEKIVALAAKEVDRLAEAYKESQAKKISNNRAPR